MGVVTMTTSNQDVEVEHFCKHIEGKSSCFGRKMYTDNNPSVTCQERHNYRYLTNS